MNHVLADETVEFEFEIGQTSHTQTGTQRGPPLGLFGRFLTDRPMRVHIMKERMAGIWHPVHGVSIRESEPGTFLFQFFHELDLQRVLLQGPWSLDNHLLILNALPEGQELNQVPLHKVPFWVQIHHI